MTEAIGISVENFMRDTNGQRPYCVIRNGRPSYYAVCPACDNPIQLIGMFRRQEESHPVNAYGRHHHGAVPDLCAYDEEAYFNCPYADPNHSRTTQNQRPADNPTSMSVYRLMHDEFDRVVRSWERFAGIHLGVDFARELLRIWQSDKGWLYYYATSRNLPQMLLYAVGAKHLEGRWLVRDSPFASKLDDLSDVSLEPVDHYPRYVRVERLASGFPSQGLSFLLHNRKVIGGVEYPQETYALRAVLGDAPAFRDLWLTVDHDWLETARRLDRGCRNERMLAIARDILPVA